MRVSSCAHAGGPAHRREQARGDDRVGEDGAGRVPGPAVEQVGAEQRAHLVTAQHPPPAGPRHGDGAPVGVGVVGDDEVGRGLLGELERGVHRAGLLRVREGDGGEHRVRLGLRGHRQRSRVAGGEEGPPHRLRPDAVQRGVDDGDVAGGAGVDDGDDVGDVGVEHVVAEGLPPVVGHRHRRHRRHAGDLRGDPPVGRRDDLRAVAEVDLVPVVLRRVVRRGDHDAGVGAEVADGVGQHRRGHRVREHGRPAAHPRDDRTGVVREDVRVGAGVEPDDDERLRVEGLQVGGEPGGRADDDRPVHPVGSAAEPSAQAGRPELEHPGHGVGELLGGGFVARLGAVGEPGELGPGGRVRVVGSPGAGGGEQVGGGLGAHRRPLRCARRRRRGGCRTAPRRPGRPR